MASSGKGKGSVKTVEWWKHLKHRKRDQQKLVRSDGKQQCGVIEIDDTLLHLLTEDYEEMERRAHGVAVSLYQEGILNACPECESERPKHKMDCGFRWEERHVREQ